MATRGRNSPGTGRRRDARPGGQRGFKNSKANPPRRARDDADRAGQPHRGGSGRAGRDERSGGPERSDRPDRSGGARRGADGRRRGAAPRAPDADRQNRPPGADRANFRDRAARDGRPGRAGAGAAHVAKRPGHGPKPVVPRAAGHSEPERLQKVLARMGVASRREAEEWIRAGRITVNGQVAVLGARVGRTDHLRLDGRLIHRHEVAAGQVYLCHRSPGENLRTPDEPTEHQALLDRLPRKAGNRFISISPMPRIDGGLELVTSDGAIAAQLQRTVHSLASEFSVRVRGELEERTLQGILEGTLDRGERLQVESCEPGGGEAANRWYALVARGGSGKDVRQLFERHGALVSRVLRTRMGTLELDRHLSRGQFRALTQDEVDALISPPAPEAEANDAD